jgi:signal peptidase I
MHSEADTTRTTGRRRWRIVAWIALATLALMVAVWSIAFRTYVNEGDSMAPALASGDRVIVNRLASGGVGDLVVVTVGDAGVRRQVVRRIVAVGGDTIGYVGCRVVRNGAPVDAPYETIDQPCVADDLAETAAASVRCRRMRWSAS